MMGKRKPMKDTWRLINILKTPKPKIIYKIANEGWVAVKKFHKGNT